MSSPSGSISCFCCGNLQEVVTDTEATHISLEENLKTYTPIKMLDQTMKPRERFIFSVKTPSERVVGDAEMLLKSVYLLHLCGMCKLRLCKFFFPSPLQPQKMSQLGPLLCLL